MIRVIRKLKSRSPNGVTSLAAELCLRHHLDSLSREPRSTKRFIDPRYTFSHPARLSYRSRSNIAHYLVNYIGRDCGYSELTRNCQTFAADLCSFLAGKKEVVPFHPVNRVEHHNRTHLFLYDSSMFTKRKGESLQGRLAK